MTEATSGSALSSIPVISAQTPKPIQAQIVDIKNRIHNQTHVAHTVGNVKLLQLH